ncbi:IS110 family transposase [Arthrobacter bambusae]|uniref:Transposase n=1 Tax=Arthrobacter bambusae TaxID=1338426 RepID=A0AAW8DKN1_9MICC|nr:IS110 family transposase [Arthrobacter bambusae]MDP9906511.1 transposase [Arthrobacter bambusae]MDQ0130051.1 transposase [Arthrobacter bambusae]MDQ0181431.1 transposase [Arthrobacter bambusae]
MSIVAHSHPFVVGVDTHARNHVYAIIATTTGELLQTRDFPTTSAGINRAIAWVARLTGADLGTLWVIEGAASYGALLAGAVGAAGYQVAEAARMDARARHGVGKSDPLDAHRIAAAVLPLEEQQLRRPRLNDGVRTALRVLVTARESMTTARTRSVNALTALLRVNDLGLDARKPLTGTQIAEVSRWRSREEPLAASVARAEAVRLAKHLSGLDADIKTNTSQITELVEISEAAPLLQETGFGPVTAAICLTAWSHQGRVRSEAAFASLAGVSPIPASSGNTVRHRLNRGGDRTLNKALHMVARSRMTFDPATVGYVEKRQAEGRTKKEIRRCVKRYLARRIYRTLNATSPAPCNA